MRKLIGKMSVITLLLGAQVGGHTNVRAADQQTEPKSGLRAVTAKIIVVDRAAKALTVDVNGTIHLYWLAANVKVRNDGKDVTIADLAPGQSVKFITQKTAAGNREVVVEIAIEQSDAQSEAAGRARATKLNSRAHRYGRDNLPDRSRGAPPVFAPPPVTRPTVSPHN